MQPKTPVRHKTAALADSRTRWSWWLATRGLVALIAFAMMFHHDWKHVFDDLNVYSHWGELLATGQVPSNDPMWQYPPLAAFVFGAIGLLGSAPWLFLIFFVGVDLAITWLFIRDGRARGTWHGLAVWLAAPLLLGPIMYGRYDSVPTFTALLGLMAIATPVGAGAALGLGGGLKVWPAIIAFSLATRDWAKGALGAALALGATLVAAAATFPTIISGFLGNGEARGLQTESVAALPFVWARMFGADIPAAFRYGSSEVAVPLADALAPLLLPLTGLGLVALVLARLIGWLDRAPIADIAFVAVLWLMVTSRVLSPQYNVWLVGMAALVWAAGSVAMRWATIPVFVTALAAQALYPFSYIDINDGGFAGTMVHTVRILALLAALALGIRALAVSAAPARSRSVSVAVGSSLAMGAPDLVGAMERGELPDTSATGANQPGQQPSQRPGRLATDPLS